MSGRRGIAIVMSGFPRRSETFALGELLALEARGVLAGVFATKAGDGLPPHEAAARLAPYVEWLDEGDSAQQAAALAARLAGRALRGVHAYFAHEPADVAWHAARRLGVPFGFSAHARDARKAGAEGLARRAKDAAVVIACNVDVRGELQRAGVHALLLPHGVDLEQFTPAPTVARAELGLLAVGRLVPKKGFDLLLRALTHMSGSWRLTVVGEGPEGPSLRQLAAALGLTDRVRWAGSLTHAHLPAAYAEADVVVVPSVFDRTGDRDGLPNVVLEAMACGRAVLGTDAGALSSALVDGDTGLVAPAGDVRALARGLHRLAVDPPLRARLGRQARRFVAARFDVRACAARFADTMVARYV